MNKKMSFVWAYVFFAVSCFAQIQQPNNEFRQIAIANVGYDYNLISINLGYAYYKPTYKTSAFIDIAQGTALLGSANLRTQIGLQTWQGSFKKLNLRTLLAFVHTHANNKAGNYDGLGLNLQINAGFHRSILGGGADFQYNRFFATHIKHTDFWRQYYYSAAKDGWYKNTANNIRLGGYITAFLNKRNSMEFSLRGGYQSSGQFDKIIPGFYAIIGINKRF